MAVQTQQEPLTMSVRGQTQPQPKINAALKISNLSSLVLPIGGGIKLQPGQTRTMNTPSLQVIEELIPRLNRLVAAGKVSYKLMPAAPTDIANLSSIKAGIKGVLGVLAGTHFAYPDYTSGTGSLGYIVDRPSTIQGISAAVGTAPGGTDTVVVTVYLNGVATTLVATITGTATATSSPTPQPVGPQDVLDLNAGDKVQFLVTSSAGTAADLMISLQLS